MSKGCLAIITGMLVLAGSVRAESPAPIVRAKGDYCCDTIQDNAFAPEMPRVLRENENAFTEPDPGCCRHPAWYFSGEYLLWWVKSANMPPLVTTSANDAGFGILGDPNTQVLIGGDLNDQNRNGARVTLGYWCDCDYPFGVELTGFFLGARQPNYNIAAGPTGSPVISRPVVNALTGNETVLSVALPTLFTGNINVIGHSTLYGSEGNLVIPLSCTYAFPELFVGFRYLNLREEVFIQQRSQILANGLAAFNGGIVGPGNSLNFTDDFNSMNQFLGGQLGTRWECDKGRLFFNVLAKVAVGVTRQKTDISGGTVMITPTGATSSVPGGLLALSTNTGTITNNEFSIVPEIGLNVGVHLTKCVHMFAGYNFLYWNRVVRAAEQIDRTVNPEALPTSVQFGPMTGPARPFQFQQSDFWAHGLNFGLAVIW